MMYHPYLEQIENVIKEAISETRLPRALNEPIHFAVCTGGKRLRPIITVLATEACDGPIEPALRVGAAIEILHNFTLVHDDIMDRSVLRRGQPTVHVRWNEAHAILAGDTMVGIAYQLLTKSLPPERCQAVIAELSSAFVDICIGQAEDLSFQSKPNVEMEEYFDMIRRKTARLFAASAVTGGLIANAQQHVLDTLRTYGTELGVAFQIQDDVLDIIGDVEEFGKVRAQDLREGKKTYPILCAYAYATDPADRQLIETYFQNGTIQNEAEIQQFEDICHRLGITTIAIRTIENSLQKARRALELLPPSPARQALASLLELTSHRRS